MRAVVRILAVVLVLAVIGGGAYAYFHLRPGGAAPVAQSSPCPETNELAGIEGYAPGAGGAAKTGQNAVSSMGGFGGAVAGGDATPSPAPAGTCAPVAQRDPTVTSLDALAAAIPKEEFDVDARAKSLADADAAYAFVRDGVALDAYAGALRGARGALIAGAANADDKALLLAALLRAHGETVRFARSTLGDADAASLARAASAPAAPRPVPTTNPALLAAAGVRAADVQATANDTLHATASALDDAVRIATQHADALASELQSGGVRITGAPAATFDTTHYYVQVQRNGAWTDADPMPGVAFGSHLGTADAGFGAEAMPDDRFTAVTLTVRATHADGAATDLVTKTATSADLAGVPIHVFVSPDGTNALAKSATSTSFTPALHIAGDVTSGEAIDLTASGTAAVTAADLVVTVKGTAGTRTATRRFFTRAAGDANVAAAAKLANAYDVVVAPGPMNESFELAQTIATLRNALNPADGTDLMPLPVVQLLHLDGVFTRALTRRDAVRFTYDRPVIAMLHRGFTGTSAPRPSADVDIVDNGQRPTGADAVVAAKANIARGYMDTIIETNVLDGAAVGAPQVFAAAKTAGIADRTLPASSPVPPDAPAAAKDQLAATLASGSAAIVASRAVQLGAETHVAWWSIDPASGNTVGRLESGAGQGITEYNRVQSEVARRGGPLVEFYGDFWRCIAWGVEAPLEGSGPETEVAFLTCVANAYCHLLQSIVNDAVPEDKAENAMEAATIREALQLVLKQRAEAYAQAQIEARTGSLDAKKRLDDAMGKVCDAAFSSPFHSSDGG